MKFELHEGKKYIGNITLAGVPRVDDGVYREGYSEPWQVVRIVWFPPESAKHGGAEAKLIVI